MVSKLSSKYLYILALLPIAFILCSYTDGARLSVREAQEVVAQADSLWHNGQMYGVDEGDSATLAQAYERLKEHSAFSRQFSEVCPFVHRTSFLRTYTHACYHYGKLLRAKDDPVAAMQAFINATHSHTRDYHILGRVYSNMGSICHLAGEFPLAYDMFERSAEMYLKNGDTLSYFFLLNDMAFELAEQGMKKETYEILSLIRDNIADPYLHIKTMETRAVANKKTKQYDSTLYYTKQLLDHGCCDPSVVILRAQVFSLLGQNDSAVYYAQWVLKHSPKLSHRNNALYIIANDSKVDNVTPVRQAAADRSDVQRLLSVRQGKLSQAVQLLEQDMSAKPDRRWILSLISFILFSGVLIFVIYIWKKRKQHQHILQDIQIKEEQQTRLVHEIDSLSHIQQVHHDEIMANMEQFCQLCENDKYYYEHLHWNNYAEMCEIVNRYLYNVIARLEPYNLSEKETRLCVLVLLKATTDQMVNLIPYSHSGLGKFKYTIARKLGTTTSNLRVFILNLLG